MEKLKQAQRNCLRILKRQTSQVSDLRANLNCTPIELSDETTKLLDAITKDAIYDQVFDQCQTTHKAARHSTSRKENDSRIKSAYQPFCNNAD